MSVLPPEHYIDPPRALVDTVASCLPKWPEERLPCDEPTDDPPGSPEHAAALRERQRLRQELTHPEDLTGRSLSRLLELAGLPGRTLRLTRDPVECEWHLDGVDHAGRPYSVVRPTPRECLVAALRLEDGRVKRCLACGEVKELTLFGARRERHDGRSSRCLACERQRMKRYTRGAAEAGEG